MGDVICPQEFMKITECNFSKFGRETLLLTNENHRFRPIIFVFYPLHRNNSIILFSAHLYSKYKSSIDRVSVSVLKLAQLDARPSVVGNPKISFPTFTQQLKKESWSAPHRYV
jgi:hypothetical protein